MTTPKLAEFAQQLREQDDSWSVWRQDDNGNQAVVAEGLSKSEADKIASEYEAKGHKQLYWVTQDNKP